MKTVNTVPLFIYSKKPVKLLRLKTIKYSLKLNFKNWHPKNWFNEFKEIEITLEEFAPKKSDV